ncbi:hypothetical protein N9077_01450 [bacterium]|nr:hypothetical protein [Akkermansiaceae bacterium]MDB4466351.1 hypothetical protein [bacterium]
MTDYLMRKSDGKVIEGSTRKKDVERIWSFTFENGQWLVSDIDEGSNSLAYVDMMKKLPAIADHFPSGRDVAHSSSSSDGDQ